MRMRKDSLSCEENALFFQAIFDVASQWGSGPVVIAGDFNSDSFQEPVLVSALATGQWFDLAAMDAAKREEVPCPTCTRFRGLWRPGSTA